MLSPGIIALLGFVLVSIQRRESEIGVLTTGFELAELAILTTVVLQKTTTTTTEKNQPV